MKFTVRYGARKAKAKAPDPETAPLETQTVYWGNRAKSAQAMKTWGQPLVDEIVANCDRLGITFEGPEGRLSPKVFLGCYYEMSHEVTSS